MEKLPQLSKKSRRKNKNLGDIGEKLAESYLLKKSYKILNKNYIPKRWGEIDIIALSPKKEICFIEVKTRTDQSYGYGTDAINFHKIKSIMRTANYFLNHEGKKYSESPMLLLAICVDMSKKDNPEIEEFIVD